MYLVINGKSWARRIKAKQGEKRKGKYYIFRLELWRFLGENSGKRRNRDLKINLGLFNGKFLNLISCLKFVRKRTNKYS